MIPMINLGTEPVVVTRGTRIAQLVFQRVELVQLEEVRSCRRASGVGEGLGARAYDARLELLGWSMVAGCLALAPARAPAQQSPLGAFQGHGDVGQVTRRGSVTYAGRGRYTIAGQARTCGSTATPSISSGGASRDMSS